MNRMKRIRLALIFSTFTSFSLLSAEDMKVDYYGVVSKSNDANLLKMAQDIFYTQLKSIDYITVDDKRPDTSKASSTLPKMSTEDSRISFYAEIEEINENGQKNWNCRFNAINPEDEIIHSKTEIYESYYKILAGAKKAIESVMLDLRPKVSNDDFFQRSSTKPQDVASVPIKSNDIESLSGTWNGEPFTDKIMILRGGRGFIIYKNGATMNIKVSAKKTDENGNVTEIQVKQVGKSNASFFPDLPRQVALELAPNASPIEWNFEIVSGELKGTKKTLIPATNEIGAVEGSSEASWNRR